MVVVHQQHSLNHYRTKKNRFRLFKILLLTVSFLSLTTLLWNVTSSLFMVLVNHDERSKSSEPHQQQQQQQQHQQLLLSAPLGVVEIPSKVSQQQQQPQPQSSTTQTETITKTKLGKRNKRKRDKTKTATTEFLPKHAIFNQSDLVVEVVEEEEDTVDIGEQQVPTTTTTSKKKKMKKSIIQVHPNDFIYSKSGWNSAPVVIQSHKLIFFTVQKVGCTVWKQLLRRMMGYTNWRDPTIDPANPKKNGLEYLYHYNISEATKLMNSNEYKRVLFVRDPKEKFLSAFLDKAYKGKGGYVMRVCGCHDYKNESQVDCRKRLQTFQGFVEETRTCYDTHWAPQSERMETKYISTLNFIGHFDTIQNDTIQLLQQINAYDQYGKTGWGKYHNESIYQSTGTVIHASGKTKQLLTTHYTPLLENEIDERFKNDYNIPQFGLRKKKIIFS